MNLASKRRWRAIAATVATVAVTVVGVKWLADHRAASLDPDDEFSLEAQWNAAIRKLGVEPIFPPEEDLAVGDLIAAVVEDDKSDPTYKDDRVRPSTPFLGKSVKLAHIDVRDELEDAYAQLPVFPDSIASPDARRADALPGSPAPLASASPGLFKPGAQRRALPMAAFPGLTISHGGEAAAGASNTWLGMFGFGSSRRNSEKLILPLVEAYGLPSVRASTVLEEYCQKNRKLCSEEFARKHLVPIFGERVLSQYLDNQTGEYRYGTTIRIFMVSRVYLVRAIVNQQQAGAAEGGVARAGSRTPPSADKPPAGSEPPAGATAREVALQSRLDAVERQLASLQNVGTGDYRAHFNREILMDQTFPRPVAIGYRYVIHETNPDAKK